MIEIKAYKNGIAADVAVPFLCTEQLSQSDMNFEQLFYFTHKTQNLKNGEFRTWDFLSCGEDLGKNAFIR